MPAPGHPPADDLAADRNWRLFVAFRVLFNARFYYPVLAVFFLDLGLSATQYTLLNFAWALAILAVDLPAGLVSLAFAGALRAARDGSGSAEATFGRTPPWLGLTLAGVALGFWRRRVTLGRVAPAAPVVP